MSNPTTTADIEPADSNAAFRRLRALATELGPKASKHDLAITLISACIMEGIDTRPRIVGALKRLELNHAHVAILLDEGQGGDPRRCRWVRDPNGCYSLHG